MGENNSIEHCVVGSWVGGRQCKVEEPYVTMQEQQKDQEAAQGLE